MPCAASFWCAEPVQQVQLADRGAAEAVDHERDLVAERVRQVGDDRAEQLVDDLVGADQLGAATAGLAVDADADLHLVVGRARTAASPWPAACTAVSAMPMVRVTELTFSPIRTSSSRTAPASAAAPTAFMTKKFPATPRRPTVHVESLHGDVVVDEQRPHVQALGLGQLRGHLERHLVAGVVVDQQQDALVRGQQLGGLQHVLHRRRREHVTGTGAVEHALADDHDVRRLVARSRSPG